MEPRVFFLNGWPTTGIYTLSLHDALPISVMLNLPPLRERGDDLFLIAQALLTHLAREHGLAVPALAVHLHSRMRADRKSTRLNSSHRCISYAVFCLKKKITRLCPLHVEHN